MCQLPVCIISKDLRSTGYWRVTGCTQSSDCAGDWCPDSHIVLGSTVAAFLSQE